MDAVGLCVIPYVWGWSHNLQLCISELFTRFHKQKDQHKVREDYKNAKEPLVIKNAHQTYFKFDPLNFVKVARHFNIIL